MSKDELLLKILSDAWSCASSNEIREGLLGANGTDPEEVKKHYPGFNTFDPNDDDGEDNESEVQYAIHKDVDGLLERLKKFLSSADSYNNTFIPSK